MGTLRAACDNRAMTADHRFTRATLPEGAR
jgi:hypothetical protein